MILYTDFTEFRKAYKSDFPEIRLIILPPSTVDNNIEDILRETYKVNVDKAHVIWTPPIKNKNGQFYPVVNVYIEPD